MDFVSWKDRKPVAAELKAIYRATDADAGPRRWRISTTGDWGRKISGDRAELAAQLGAGHPVLRLPRRRAPDHLHHERHRGLERQTARAVRTRGHFPTDEAAIKLLYLVLRQVAQNGKCRHANGARRRPSSPSCSTTLRQSVMAKPAPHTKFLTVPNRFLCLWTVHLCTGTPSQTTAIALSSPGPIDDEEFGPPQAAPDEIVKHGAPGLRALAAHALHREQHLLAVRAHADDNEQRDRGRLAVEPHPHDRAVENQPHDRLSASERAFQASQSPFTLRQPGSRCPCPSPRRTAPPARGAPGACWCRKIGPAINASAAIVRR